MTDALDTTHSGRTRIAASALVGITALALCSGAAIARQAGHASKIRNCQDARVAGTPPLVFGVLSAKGTTCRAAITVFRAVARWATQAEYQTLGAPKHPNTLGYRCYTHLVGDSSWIVRCVKGDRVIRAMAAV